MNPIRGHPKRNVRAPLVEAKPAVMAARATRLPVTGRQTPDQTPADKRPNGQTGNPGRNERVIPENSAESRHRVIKTPEAVKVFVENSQTLIKI
ncbi:MAG: hypothetical protein ACK58T_15515 [Phycisphaerae bacterium]